jgi:hypothetical protein
MIDLGFPSWQAAGRGVSGARKCAEFGLTLQQCYLHGRPRAARSIISRGLDAAQTMDAALSAPVLSR